MKQLPTADEEFARNFDSLLNRLVDAGMVQSFSRRRTPCVVWNKDYQPPMGGRAAFLGLAMLLAEICPDRPLSTDEQAMIQILSQAEEEQESPET